MSSNSKKKVKQDDLRRLMKERRADVQTKKQKIDSPLAKYEFGRLYCISCNVQIKNESLWSSHIIGKIHKENIQKKKKKSCVSFATPSIMKYHEKINAAKAIRHEKSPEPMETEEASNLTESGGSNSNINSLNQHPSSDEDNLPKEGSSQNQLPTDFFDTPQSSESTTVVKANTNSSEEEKKSSELVGNSAESLPEGFFDNPILDAKVRNIEYKDPAEEEWEKFKKTIEEETNLSKSIMEEDVVESTVERNIEQIDQQIRHWETVKSLQSKFEEECLKKIVKQTETGSESSDEDLLDDLLDWRSKGVRR